MSEQVPLRIFKREAEAANRALTRVEVLEKACHELRSVLYVARFFVVDATADGRLAAREALKRIDDVLEADPPQPAEEP